MQANLLRPLNDIQRITSLSSAQTITPTTGAKFVIIQPLTKDIYVTLRGEVPTTTNGYLVSANSLYQIDVSSDTVIKVIEKEASAEVRWQSFTYNEV